MEEYSEETLLAELRRVAGALEGKKLTRKLFDSLGHAHSSTISGRFGSWDAALDRAGISEAIAPRNRRISRDQVILALKRFAIENPDMPASIDEIAALLSVHRATIGKKLGAWGTLLSEAGVTAVPMGRRYSEEECFENILALWTHYGRQPHFGELMRSPSTVGSKAYVRRWGSWRAALSAFVKRVENEIEPPVELVLPVTPLEIEDNDNLVAVSKAPRSIPLSLRYKVLCRDRFRCVICGASPAKDLNVELHVDHIHPWSLKAPNNKENLRTLCSKCNLGKGAKIENL